MSSIGTYQSSIATPGIVSTTGRAQPTRSGPTNSLEHFEKLMTEITDCPSGRGTLHRTSDGRYTNPHTQYLWEYYQAK